MPPAEDQDYTEVLGFDFSQPGVLPDHGGECGGGGNGIPGGETLPLAYTETQLVDGCGEQLDLGVKDWDETQVIDEFQETEVVRGDEEGGGQSERTELVTEDNDDFGEEVGSVIHTKDGNLVDPDSSTVEEDGFGSDGPGDISSLQCTGGSCKSSDECPKKSFVTIRVAALRSGFAAARNRTFTPIINKSESSDLPEGKFNACNQDNVEDNYSGLRANWMETIPCNVSNLNNVGTKKDEIVLDHDPLRAAVGYVSSQEPGIQSQAIALGVVDKFLSVNDLELSQPISNVNADTVMSPPIASVKKAQSFVMKSDKNTVLNADVFEWNDSLEDEGGGALFRKREYSSIDSKGSKQRFFSLPLEVIPRVSELIIGADNNGNNEGSKSKTCQNLASIFCSGSKLKHIQSERHVHAYKTRSKKKHFNEMEEPENTGRMEQLEKSDSHTFDEGVYDVGPATQIAVEAIQALCHSSPVNLGQTIPQSKSGELVGTSINLKKTRNASTRKKSDKPQESAGIMTRSKHQINITKSRTTNYNSSRKQSTNLRTKMVLEESAVEITAEETEKNLDENPERVISFNNGGSAVSIVRKKMKISVDKGAEKPLVSVTRDNQPLVGPKAIVGTSEIYTSPVAHRTRHSKTANLLNVNKSLSNDTSIDTSGISFCDRRKVETKNEHVLNAPVTPKVNTNDCNISLNATIRRGLADAFEMERVHVEETGASLDKDAFREPKRRKNNIDSENQRSDFKMNNHSKSFDVIAPKNVKLSTQRKKQRVFIRSIAEILDKVKRKRRSISSSSKCQSDGLPSNVGNAPNVSGVRTRSSLLSDILKPYFANDSNYKPQLSSKPAFDGASCTHSVSFVKQDVYQNNLKKSIKGAESSLLAEIVKESVKPDGSPDAISHPSLACSPAIGIIAVSPVVSISQDSSKISAHKSLSRPSITRELIRLEAANTSPSKLNDMRRRKNMGSFQVCFSNHLSQDIIKQQKKVLARLGIQAVSSSSEATHFVADRFVRTRNMLEAMAMGKPVVTPMWLESCGQASCYIDEKNYILRDANKEKEIGFSMPVSLANACQSPLLQGKRLFITQNTKPNQELISSLVKTAGGQLLKRIMRSISKEDKLPENILILSSEEDFAVCVPFLEKGAAVFRSELLLNGIVIQKLEYERHQLFLDQVKR